MTDMLWTMWNWKKFYKNLEMYFEVFEADFFNDLQKSKLKMANMVNLKFKWT